MFKAIYTPEDTVNYQAIEVEIEVEEEDKSNKDE